MKFQHKTKPNKKLPLQTNKNHQHVSLTGRGEKMEKAQSHSCPTHPRLSLRLQQEVVKGQCTVGSYAIVASSTCFRFFILYTFYSIGQGLIVSIVCCLEVGLLCLSSSLIFSFAPVVIMTILTQLNDCHCCNDARSLVQKKNLFYSVHLADYQ